MSLEVNKNVHRLDGLWTVVQFQAVHSTLAHMAWNSARDEIGVVSGAIFTSCSLVTSPNNPLSAFEADALTQ